MLLKRAAVFIFLALLFSCGKNETVPLYHTWDSLKEREYGEPFSPPPEEIPPPGFIPWAGAVSHHLLAHDYIDSWVSGLGNVNSDKKKVRKLAKSLKVDLDPSVFNVEHGASTLMP